MMPALVRRALPALSLLGLVVGSASYAAMPKVPEGFEVRLVATVPAVTYPCQVATAPDGSLFIAEDPMDQIGPYEANHGRILLVRDGKDPVVFADGFRAIFGMTWYEGALYVCHMPFLTVLRDTDGDGKVDERKDLFKDLGPTNNQGLNDHIVSGLQFGMDGYLYVSVGDKGVPKATGPDGRTVQIKGGGSLRLRPDGTGIEVVSYGTRNHLEPNLDDRDNMFTYDNTDDGDGWWTRVTHHIDGGYYGYPYDYHNHTDRMLPRMAEYGGGSPCGALIYKEDAWPEKYRGVGFWAEWGKGKIHAFRFAPQGATFKIAEEIDFAVPDGVSNFRPIDLALSYDGATMYVADWNMGGWGSKTEKVGRVFAITYKGEVPLSRPRGKDDDSIEDQIKQLDHPSFNERMRAQRALAKKGKDALPAVTTALADTKLDPTARRHLIWALDAIAGATPEATLPLIKELRSDVADLRAQAARALGERRVPIAVEPLVALLKDSEPTVRLQAVIGLGRIGDPQAVAALVPVLLDTDRYVAFSARMALRRIGDWKETAKALVSPDPKIRLALLAAMEQQYDPDVVAALAGVALGAEHPAPERTQAIHGLCDVHRKALPWDGRWWGTRPTQGAPPAKVESWPGTKLVIDSLKSTLGDADPTIRLATIKGITQSKPQELRAVLRERFESESDENVKRELALAFGKLEDKDALPLLIAALRSPKEPDTVRDAAIRSVETIGTEAGVKALVELLADPELPVERQRRVISALAKSKADAAIPALVEKLRSPAAAVRAEAAGALGKLGKADGVAPKLRDLYTSDTNAAVRLVVLRALGELKDRNAIPMLLTAADAPETRFAASLALTAVPDIRAFRIYLQGLTDKNQTLRNSSALALGSIRDQAAPILDRLAERKELPPSTLPELQKIYSGQKPVAQWHVLGPFAPGAKPPVSPEGQIDLKASVPAAGDALATWKVVGQEDNKGRIDLGKAFSTSDQRFAFAYAEIESSADRNAEMYVGSDDSLTVWVNGKLVYDYKDDRGFTEAQDHFDVSLVKGTNRILVKCGNHGGGWLFAASLTTPVEYAFLKAPSAGAFNPDVFREFALKGTGKPAHGKELFEDLKGLACVKCHAVGGKGGAVGPDLSGLGAKYARDEIIASVLYPSAKIFSGYEPVVVATNDGRVLTGIIKSDAPEALEIEDADAKRIKIPKTEIEERKTSDVSLMPNGLAEGLSKEDFADVIAYLESLKEKPAAAGGGR